MRILLVPASALVIAWSLPAGLFNGSLGDNGVTVAPIPDRATDGIAWREPDVRTTRDDVSDPVNAFYSQPSALDLAEMAFNSTSPAAPGTLDNVFDTLKRFAFGADQPPAIPLPPHRAIPHAIVCEALEAAAENNNVPAPFLIRLIWQESGFNQNAISPVGAQGVAQFMPETASRRGLDDPFNPLQAVRASARLLRDLVHRFGNLGLAAAAYNAGTKRVQDWLDKRGNLPQETRDYVKRITGLRPEDWTAKSILPVALEVPEKSPCRHEGGVFAADGEPARLPMPPAPPATVAKAEAKAARVAASAGAGHATGSHRPIEVAEAGLPSAAAQAEHAQGPSKPEMHAAKKTPAKTAAKLGAKHGKVSGKTAGAASRPLHVADAKVHN